MNVEQAKTVAEHMTELQELVHDGEFEFSYVGGVFYVYLMKLEGFDFTVKYKPSGMLTAATPTFIAKEKSCGTS